MLLALLTSACACDEGMPSDGADALDAAEEVDGGDGGGEEDADVNDGWAEEAQPDTDDPSGGDPSTDGDEQAGDDGIACPEQQPHEKYCVEIGGYECRYEISFCRDGAWTCYANQTHPPPMPEFEDWAWRCGVYKCSVPAITTEPPADWQDNPLEPYVPPEPATLTGEWVKLADLASTVPIGCERQPRQEGRAATMAVSPADPRIMYAGFTRESGNVVGVWKSVDGGVTWFEARAGLGSQGCYCFECEDPAQCEYADPAVHSLFVDSYDPDLVFASTWERGLYRTEDGGRYWTKVELPLPWPEACMATEHFGPMGPVGRGPDGVYHAAACGDYHFASYDLGETWESWGQVSHGQYVNTWTFDPSNPGRIWAGMGNTPYPIAGSGWVYLSEDGGLTWRKSGADIETVCNGRGFTTNLTSCSANPDWMVVSILYCGLFMSTDGGASWHQPSAPMDDDVPFWSAFAPSGEDCVLYAARDYAPHITMRSPDGGVTWAMENESIAIGWLFFDPFESRHVVGLRSPWNGPPNGAPFEVWARF